MTRRELLRLLALGVVNHALDLDKLLWVPGAKKIFIPSFKGGITESQIVALELERVLPKIRALFERDDVFYKMIQKDGTIEQTIGTIRIPLEIKDR